jgi:hypothetical protein
MGAAITARAPLAAVMVEVVAADEQDWLLDSVRESFDYSSTA